MSDEIVVSGHGISRDFVIGESRIPALNPCDIEITRGSTVVILGKSGSGKSTLCNVLSGVDKPTMGTVRILGHDLAELSDARMSQLRAQELGFVLQRDNLIPWLTIEENVAAPLITGGMKRKDALEVARDYLRVTDLEHRARSWPSLVSGGEAQRAAVARACINKPSIVFADEPTGALDRQNGDRVRDLFKSLVHENNSACILVTHDADLATDADVLVRMVDGSITFDPEENISRLGLQKRPLSVS